MVLDKIQFFIPCQNIDNLTFYSEHNILLILGVHIMHIFDCNKPNAIKYLFKYVHKGPDRVTAEISSKKDNSEPKRVVDEIKQYYDCRYISLCEAMWRIYAFDIHLRLFYTSFSIPLYFLEFLTRYNSLVTIIIYFIFNRL